MSRGRKLYLKKLTINHYSQMAENGSLEGKGYIGLKGKVQYEQEIILLTMRSALHQFGGHACLVL